MTDDAALAKLTAQYCHRFDDGAMDALLDLFTPDATVEFGGQRPTGHQELAAFFTAIAAATAGGRHLCMNHEFDIDGETAGGVVDFLLMRANGEPPMVGRYHDTYRRADGRWRFATRTIVPAG